MKTYYTDERNMQMLIYLMKQHGIRKVIASPGTTNITFVASIQHDSWFEVYSCVDERSAAYIACGMAAECGEPVALSCTGATASRNYISGLTEAFYRKLPVLAITATQHTGRIGHNVPQVIDRSNPLNDICVYSATIPAVHDKEDEWAYSVKINEALLELTHKGGGPVHLNMVTQYSDNFNVKELPVTRIINRININDKFPTLSFNKVGIFVGNHLPWAKELTETVDKFCEQYNAVVLCDHTSNYNGNYGVMASLVTSQLSYDYSIRHLDLLIDIGNISGAYLGIPAEEVWRINPDGKIRDTYKKLRYIFEMDELAFFKEYINTNNDIVNHSFYDEWVKIYNLAYEKIPEDIPFSNIWIAKQTINKLPENSVLYLGILNSLRSWNFFEKSNTVTGFSNTGGFGIDGGISSLIGASLASPEKLFFCVTGDLSFFYDMNAIGNRHIKRNIRILLINNGKGTEFRNYSHKGAKFGEAADEYIAAAGHYGHQSSKLIKHYTEDLGFLYLSAINKHEYTEHIDEFISPEIGDKPIIYEVFTNSQDESDALFIMNHLLSDTKGQMKTAAKKILGDKGIAALKKIVK